MPKTNDTTHDKPFLRLVGQDGNAFSIMGHVKKAARKANWTDERIEAMLEEMRAGDYDALLRTVMKHFDVH